MAVDWTPLAEDDPLPGDPLGVSQLAGLLAADALELRSVIEGLNKVDTCEIWSGENADRFSTAKGDVVPDLQMVAKRMDDAAKALTHFVPGMADSQALARTALYRIRGAMDTLARANAGLDEAAQQRKAAKAAEEAARNHPDGSPSPAPAPSPAWGPNWAAVRDEAWEEYDAAQRLFDAACRDYAQAAKTCAHGIGVAGNDDLKNPHSGGFLGLGHVAEGLGHVVSVGTHAVADGLDTTMSWVGDHFPTLDEFSEVLGVAAAIASLTGCEPLALALAGTKTAIDVGLAMAGEKDWSAVRDDAIGFALFGAGRVLTGYARAKTGLAGAVRAEQAAGRVAKSERALKAAEDSEKAAAVAKRLRGEKAALDRFQQVKVAFKADADAFSPLVDSASTGPISPFLRQGARMFKDIEADAPALSDLTLSKRALYAGVAKQGMDIYGRVGEVRELYRPVQELGESHGLPFPADKEFAERIVDTMRLD